MLFYSMWSCARGIGMDRRPSLTQFPLYGYQLTSVSWLSLAEAAMNHVVELSWQWENANKRARGRKEARRVGKRRVLGFGTSVP